MIKAIKLARLKPKKGHLLIIFLIVSSVGVKCQLIIDSLNIVDYHVHIFSKEVLLNLEHQGYDMRRSGFRILNSDKEDYMNIEKIWRDNHRAKMVLISTAYAFRDSSNQNPENEVRIVQKENNLLRDITNINPEKFVGFYGINPLKEYALSEIKRCHEKLGLDGLKLHFQGNHVNLDDSLHLSLLQQIFKYSSQENIPLLIHNNAWDNNKGKVYAQQFINQILNRNDSLTIIFAHGGGGGAFYKFTLDFLTEFEKYLNSGQNQPGHDLYFELSSVVQTVDYPGSQDLSKLELLMQQIGYDRFLFGSDYPVIDSSSYLQVIIDKLNIAPEIIQQIVERDIFSKK